MSVCVCVCGGGGGDGGERERGERRKSSLLKTVVYLHTFI